MTHRPSDRSHGLQRIQGLLTLAGVLLLTACASTPPPAPQVEAPVPEASSVLYAWVQQGSGTTASARAIVSATATGCPQITVNETKYLMQKRTTSPANFTEVFVCEYPLSSASPPDTLAIGFLTLPPPTQDSDQILVVGDTGCRKKGSDQQDCDGDPADGAWGWPDLSEQAADTQPDPDVILHVGDYLYRESGCELCGYKWTTWDADFFEAAEAGGVLRKAPWIFVRGNHEDCSRAWHGYFLFLAPGPWSDPSWSSCPTVVDPFAVNLDGLDIYMVDTSSESASDARKSYSTVNSMLSGSTTNAWLATHVPVCDDFECDGEMGVAFTTSGLGGADQLKWIHVGHIHLFEQINGKTEAPPHPPQTVTGGSGTELDSSSTCASGDQIYCDATAYTYMTITSQASSWDANLYALGEDDPKQTFTIAK